MVTHLAACNIRKAKKLWKSVVIYMVWRSGKDRAVPVGAKALQFLGVGFVWPR